MVGKRVQFGDDIWEALVALGRRKGKSFKALTDEAFEDLLKKHKQPVGLMESLKESVRSPSQAQRKRT